jgi:hypothetical protein
MKTKLTDENLQLAIKVGNLRTGLGKDRGDYLKCDRSPSGSHDRSAAIAECAIALETGFDWFAYSDLHLGRSEEDTPDVGPLEVKSIRKPKHKLILHSEPQMRRPHVLVLVTDDVVEIIGWCFGFEVWREELFDKTLPTPAHARGSDQLYSLDSLLAWCESYGYNPKLVKTPNFAAGWEPAS